MAKGIFGWSYPPGCSGPPDEVDLVEMADRMVVELDKLIELNRITGVLPGAIPEILQKVSGLISDLATYIEENC